MGKPNSLGGEWCKHCNVFVKDLPIEKKNHEISFKHQNNIQRTLRQIHKNKEQRDREQQQARAEVARLNGGVQRGQATTRPAPSHQPRQPGPTRSAAAIVEDRKRQMEQLANMGASVPQEYRKDVAMAGEWTTVSESVVLPSTGFGTDDDDQDTKPTPAASDSSRKRRAHANDQEPDELEHNRVRPKKKWGSSLKTYPGSASTADDADLDALLAAPMTRKSAEPKSESAVKSQGRDESTLPALKKSESEEQVSNEAALASTDGVKTEPISEQAINIPVFKKRRPPKG